MARLVSAMWSCPESDDAAVELLSETVRVVPGRRAQVYRLTGGGEDMDALGRSLARLNPARGYRAPTHLTLCRLDTVAAGLEWDAALRARVREADVVEHALYAPVSHAMGPLDTNEDEFAGAIQFGTFSMSSVESEWELTSWYEESRLPSIQTMQGAVRATRYVSVAGPAKYAVLYEFASLDERLAQFEKPHETHALDPRHPTGHVVASTIHAPMSPSIGYALRTAPAGVS